MKNLLPSCAQRACAASLVFGAVLLVTPGLSTAQDPAAGKPAPARVATTKPALSVAVVRPQTQELPVRVAANGNLAAWQELSLGAEAGGLRINHIHVQIGDTVQAGQVLVELEAATVQAELAQARANLAEAEASLTEARLNAERARSIASSGALSAQQVGQLQTAEQTAQARLSAAQAMTALQEQRLRQTRITAPQAGTVSARSATLGAVTQPGQELLRLVRDNRVEWRAEVASADLARIKTGQKASLTSPSGSTIQGRVRTVAPTVDVQTRQALVYVDLPASAFGAGFRPGMYARGDFELGRSSALTLPQTALALREGFSYVFTIGADQKVRQVKVQVGRRSGERVEVSGVQAGDSVVATGAAFLADGDTVRVVAK